MSDLNFKDFDGKWLDEILDLKMPQSSLNTYKYSPNLGELIFYLMHFNIILMQGRLDFIFYDGLLSQWVCFQAF